MPEKYLLKGQKVMRGSSTSFLVGRPQEWGSVEHTFYAENDEEATRKAYADYPNLTDMELFKRLPLNPSLH